jgi:hypothetical protein
MRDLAAPRDNSIVSNRSSKTAIPATASIESSHLSYPINFGISEFCLTAG